MEQAGEVTCMWMECLLEVQLFFHRKIWRKTAQQMQLEDLQGEMGCDDDEEYCLLCSKVDEVGLNQTEPAQNNKAFWRPEVLYYKGWLIYVRKQEFQMTAKISTDVHNDVDHI